MTKSNLSRNTMLGRLSKAINITHYLNRIKEKTHRNFSTSAEKTLDKIQQPLIIKVKEKFTTLEYSSKQCQAGKTYI